LIYPTRAAVIAVAAGIPVAIGVATVDPGQWFLALAWPLAVVLLCLADAAQAAPSARVEFECPAFAYVGETRDCSVSIQLRRRTPGATAEVAFPPSPLVRIVSDGRVSIPLNGGGGAASVAIDMVRRGVAAFDRLSVRWTGPLRLAWRQATVLLPESRFPILPDLRPLHDRGAEIFKRHAFEGLIAQQTRGEGADFDALVEFQRGMDTRSIAWKQSARHSKLLAKQYRTERNNQIVFAVDSGRQMSEPVAGLPRVDRCVSAMLLTAWIALKFGDRVAIEAFDSRPRVLSGFASGAPAFAEIQRLAAEIDYSGDETNYTFALTTLGARLTRRSMIILFTEFTDPISSEFLVRAARRLVAKHLLLIVILRDEELESMVDRAPESADDVTRAVTAAALLKERMIAVTGLQHLGVHVIEADQDRVAESVVAGYLDLKRRNLL
jgi:uncharacterized protein (DUF58 family)